ncbi:ester cyclase [Haladaptatus sp. NG-WS-4]
MTTTQDNEAVARRLFEEVWQNHNYDVIDEVVAKDYVLHDPSMPEEEASEWPSGREGYRMMAEMGSGIIDGPLEVEQIVPGGDNVVIRWKQTGTHVGEMGNIEPSNEEVTITGIEIDRFEDGQLAETWQEVNMMGMLMQIGAIPDDLFNEEMHSDD